MKRSWTALLLACALPAAALAGPQYSAEEIIEHFMRSPEGGAIPKPGVRGAVVGGPDSPQTRGVFIGAAGFGNEASAAAAASQGAAAGAEADAGGISQTGPDTGPETAPETVAGQDPALPIPMTGASAGQAAPQAGVLAASGQPQAVVSDPGSYDLLITFELDSAVLSRQARENLDAFVAALRSRALMPHRFAVDGHTDATGTDEYNQRLSERRAAAVVDYLVSQGIESNRLVAKGHGETRPRMADAAHPDNRRVETRRVN